MEFFDERSPTSNGFHSDTERCAELHESLDRPQSPPNEDISFKIIAHLEDIQTRISKLEHLSSSTSSSEIEYSDEVRFYNWLKAEYANRLLRQSAFDQEYIVGEPCWDALLDLCIAEIEGRRISVTSLCIASGVPPTTALRWLTLLERDGMLERFADPRDKRRTFVRISKRAFENMFEYHRRIAKNR